MTALRQRMIEDLHLRGYAERTVEAYVAAVARLAQHYHRAPDQLNEAQLGEYLLHLTRERQLAGHWYRRTADPMTAADLRLVARLMRADIIVDLATRRTRAGIEVVPRRVRADTGVIDSLPTMTASTEREAAACLARWLAANTLLIGIKR